MTGDLAGHWDLDRDVTFLNHGSYGACPRQVLEAQGTWRARMESQPVRFFMGELPQALAASRGVLARFVGAQADDVAFVPNVTSGVNAVLRSLSLEPGDELLVTDHAYVACRNALDFVARRAGAEVVVVPLPFPVGDPQSIVEAMARRVTPRTRLAMVDWVTSPTALVLPIERLVRALTERGVDTLVDAAHGPGMVEINLEHLGAAYTTGNCHKWLCAPKGVGFLHVRRDRQDAIRPVVISHGATMATTHQSRFRLEFDWPGTHDPTAALSVADAIRVMEAMVPGGWPEIRARNRDLALWARDRICEAVGADRSCPGSMVGSMASVPLPGPWREPDPARAIDPLQEHLWAAHRIEIPVFPWSALGVRLIRISAQLYNERAQVERLAKALREAPSHVLEGRA